MSQEEINLDVRGEIARLDAEVSNIKEKLQELVDEMRGIKNALYLVVVALALNGGPQVLAIAKAFLAGH